MDKTQLTLALIGSAAIGALVSSIITEIGKWSERRHRRRELVFQAAIDFGKLMFQYRETGLGLAQLSLTGQYYPVLEELFDSGKLSAETEKELMKVLDHLPSSKPLAK